MSNLKAGPNLPDAVHFGVHEGPSSALVFLRFNAMNVLTILTPFVWPINSTLFWLVLTSYAFRMWTVEAVNHRFFSHRAYKASRWPQFVLALLTTQNGQRGVLWWAANHRNHHRFADTKRDPHSPTAYSFLYATASWLWDVRNSPVDLDSIRDFARFPELRWLNRFYALPYYTGAALIFVVGYLGWFGAQVTGVSALMWGFVVPSQLALLAANLVNALCHLPQVPGSFRRYATPDSSANRPLLAFFTLGAGWHNNHHRYAAGARAGFAWWEWDVSYYVLRFLQFIGFIRELKSVIPLEVRKEGGLYKG